VGWPGERAGRPTTGSPVAYAGSTIMGARLARHAVVLSLVVAALAAGGAAQWSAGASAPPMPASVGVALR